MSNGDSEFPAYAFKYSESAMQSRRKLAPELLPVLDDIVNALARDPMQFPDRVSRQGRRGDPLYLYTHPDPILIATFEVDEAAKTLFFFDFRSAVVSTQRALFISYSHADQAWIDEVKKYLNADILLWDDQKILAGSPWRLEIERALNASKGALLLVSQDFLKSSFIQEVELPRILKDSGKKVFWIHLRPSSVFDDPASRGITEFQSLQPNPKLTLSEMQGAEKERALVMINQRLLEALQTLH